jgi:hypothetical protein
LNEGVGKAELLKFEHILKVKGRWAQDVGEVADVVMRLHLQVHMIVFVLNKCLDK